MLVYSYCYLCFFYCYGVHRDLHVLTHSFPTRRSSDLSIPADALAGEVAIARKNRYLVGAERLQRRLEKWSWVLQNRARLYSGASNALAVPVVNAIKIGRAHVLNSSH